MIELREIADRVEIEALRGELTDAVMMRDFDRVAALFTPDCAMRWPHIDKEFVGREAIRSGIEWGQGLWEFFIQNLHPGVIHLYGDTATGRAYIHEFGRMRDGSSHLNYALYHDRYQRTTDGWKFSQRVYEVRYLDSTPLPGTTATAGTTILSTRPKDTMTIPNTLDLPAGSYVLDTTASRIGFRARHIVGPAVRGRFVQFDGNAHLSGGDLSQCKIHLAIRVDSIDTGNPQRDALLSAKFLRTHDHPNIDFSSTAARYVDEATIELVGDLTIQGITKSVAVQFQWQQQSDALVHLTGATVINRTDWGVNWNAATTILIGKNVALEFDITATPQA